MEAVHEVVGECMIPARGALRRQDLLDKIQAQYANGGLVGALVHDSGFSHVSWAVCDQCSLERRVAALRFEGFRQRVVVGADWDGSTEDGQWM